MAKLSSSHNEYVGEGYSVRVQHCEYRDDNGEVCDEYLGVAYPSNYCDKHHKIIQERNS